MKVAITGKGGVGKTTFTSVLCRLFAAEGKNVLAVDADPDDNLALALGFSQEIIDNILPITSMKELIEERTCTTLGGFGKMFKLNPAVEDIKEKYAHKFKGISLLNMGTVDKGGDGCYCPENVLLKKLTAHLILEDEDMMIMDMEAGIEHLGRGVAKGVDAFIVVVEPGIRSVQTYNKVKKMALDLEIDKVLIVANKIRNQKDIDFIISSTDEENYLGHISFNEQVMDSDRQNLSPYDLCDHTVKEVKAIKDSLINLLS